MTRTRSARTEFRARGWLRGLTAATCVLFVAGLVLTYRLHGVGWQSLAFAGLSVLGVAAIAESWLVRVSLRDDAVWITTLRGRRRVPRETIESVTWEKGGGVALRTAGGAWVKLPEMGFDSQGLTNSIRAWLRRTRAADGA
jgi:hypothetical protein